NGIVPLAAVLRHRRSDAARSRQVADAERRIGVHVGIIYPDSPNWPKMRWVDEALRTLGVRVSRAAGAEGFPQLSQECDVVILGHKGIGGRWPNLRDAFPKRKAVCC